MLTAAEIERRLPWRHPFRLVDRVLECTPGESIRTCKCVSAGDPLLQRHAPEVCLPSVLLLEGLSQTAAMLYDQSYPDRDPRTLPMLGFARAKLFGAPAPGDTVTFEVSAIKMISSGGVFQGIARVEGRPMAEAELAFAAQPAGEGS